MVTVDAGALLGFKAGDVLDDALGGPSATVTPLGKLSFSIPASGSVVLAP